MAEGRAQIRELPNNPTLRPAATAPDTFTGAARPIEDRNTENFVNALGFFNQNLANLGSAMARERKKKDDVLAAQHETAINLASGAKRREIVQTGMIDGVPLADARLKKMAGSADGSPWAAQMKEHLSTQNLTEMDAEAYIRQQAQEHMKGITDPFIVNGFSGYVNDVIGWAKAQTASQSIDQRQKLTETTTFQFLKTKTEEWIKAGVSPDQLISNVGALGKEVGIGKDRLTTPEMFDGQVMTIAAQLVDTNPEAAMALVTKGRDGEAPLASSPQFSSQAANLVERGQYVIRKREVATGFAARRQENYQRVLRDRDYSAFTDFQVNGEDLLAGKQKAQFLSDLTTDLDARVADGKATPAQKREEIARYTSRLNIDDPFIGGELAGITRRYSTIDAVRDPEQLKDLEDRAEIYSEYRGTFRNSLTRQLPKEDQEFYEAFLNYKAYSSPSTEGAFEFANRVTSPDAPDKVSLAPYQSTIDAGIKAKLNYWGPWNGSTSYAGLYEGQIRKVANLYVQSGMPPENAVDAATEKVMAATFDYEGDPLIGLEKAGLPEDYQSILGKMVEDYRVMDSRGKVYQGKATFVHLDGGLIAMRDRENGTFLEDEKGSMIVFNVQHLRDLSNANAKRRGDEAVSKAIGENQRQQEAVRESGKQGIGEFMMEGTDPVEEKAPARGISRAALPRSGKKPTTLPARRIIKPVEEPSDFVSPSITNKGVR